MKIQKKTHFIINGFIGLLALFTLAASSQAAAIISSDFTFGYGATAGNPITWTTTETSSSNSATTQGDFTFAPTLQGAFFSSNGPKVTVSGSNRTLVDGDSDRSGGSDNFASTISGSYTGPTPGDAAPTPNYQLSIIIDSVSIWGVSFNDESGNKTLGFGETTVGHTATSSTITLNNDSSSFLLNKAQFTDDPNYSQLVWDPTDYSVAGTSTSRSFNLVSDSNRVIDLFEVIGHVELTYDAIPEPKSITLLLAGGLALILLPRGRRFRAARNG